MRAENYFCIKMDVLLLLSIAFILIFLIFVITWFSKRNPRKQDGNRQEVVRGAAVRRPVGVRGVRQRRLRGVVQAVENDQIQEDGSNDEMEETSPSEPVDLSKLGAKKRAKLEAKAERKIQREMEEREREERKKREQQQQEIRDKQSALEREEERRQEEKEKAEREEKQRREEEDYQKLKAAFCVEEEGFEEKAEDESKNLLQEFVEYIKRNKIVILEDLAHRFNLKTSSCIERVQLMQADGILSGVIDDRGKFIYVSEEELLAVAKFVKQRGRISIAELAEHSNELINLKPEPQIAPTKA